MPDERPLLRVGTAAAEALRRGRLSAALGDGRLPVVVDETFTPGLWRLERDGMTLRAGVVRAEP